MLTHDIRGRWWWYGSTGWTFPPTFHYILLLCDRWQQRGSLTNWHLTWKCMWNKGEGVSLNSPMWKKMALIDIDLHKLNIYGDQTVDVNSVRWWVVHFSGGNSKVKDKPRSIWPCTAVTPWNEDGLDQLICANCWIMTGTCIRSWISASILWKWHWQSWNIAKSVLDVSHKCLDGNRKLAICKFVRTYWTNTGLKVLVSWIT